MDQNKAVEKNNFKNRISNFFKKALNVALRWLFLSAILGTLIFSVFVWHKYIFRSEWNEGEKQQYINEQSKFSFDKTGYKKMLDLMDGRKEKLRNLSKFEGRDIFFPEGF